jgi:prophage DNA circulation protein
MSWRDRFRPASFRGAEFKIDTGARAGGRRGVTFEYPKRNTPSDEDMGRRAQRWAITGYVIGLDYDLDAQYLEDALNADGPGLLIHPTMGEMLVRCETYTRSERKQEGNLAAFDMQFVEAGTSAFDLVTEPTQTNAQTQADTAAPAIGAQTDKKTNDVISV